ncbi:oxidoreductase [Actinobacteria bacterium OV450]|nr:oxidoreductase [Actinobacteria bacterium OV450]
MTVIRPLCIELRELAARTAARGGQWALRTPVVRTGVPASWLLDAVAGD